MTAPAGVLDRLVPGPGPTDAPGSDPDGARAWIATHGWPQRRDELWRYGPLDALGGARFAAPPDEPTSAPALPEALERALAQHPSPRQPRRAVLVNGRYAADRSRLARTPGVRCDPSAPTGPFAPGPATDAFSALNHLATPAVLRIEVDDGIDAGEIHILRLAVPTAEPVASHPRIEVVLGARSRLTLVETALAAPGSHLTNAVATIAVGPDATVDHLRVVSTGDDGAHVGNTHYTLDDRAVVRAASHTLGPGALRHAVHVELAGVDTEVGLSGLAVPLAGAHHDTTVTVAHRAGAGTSRQRFASVVADGARSSFTGHVIVAHGANGTEAEQISRNLLGGPTARADTRPWLEILTDEVRCNHGATVGRLDDDALFYLRSRGIRERDARAILLQAFAGASLDELVVPSTQSWLVTTVADVLNQIVGSTGRSAGPGATR